MADVLEEVHVYYLVEVEDHLAEQVVVVVVVA
jgi:hypothetical protein